MINVALVVGTYTGGGSGVVVGSLVKESRKFGVKYTIVTKKALAKTKDAKIIELPAHSPAIINALSKFDVVHVMGGSTLVVPALLSKRPCVFTFQGQTPPSMHGSAIKNAKAYAIEALYKATMARFDVVTCASKFGMEDIRKRYGVLQSVWIPNGVDRSLFKRSDTNEIRKLRKKYLHPLFLGVGNLYPVKGWMEMLGWFEGYSKARPKAMLLIAGEGTLRKSMQSKIDSSNLRGKVELLGDVPLTDLNKYYNACDAYVSGSPYEGFCLPAIEALACGKPLCVRKRGAMIEHALESGCGTVFLDTQKSFGEAADKALGMKPANIRKRGEKYLKPFTWENTARQYKKIYEEVLGN